MAIFRERNEAKKKSEYRIFPNNLSYYGVLDNLSLPIIIKKEPLHLMFFWLVFCCCYCSLLLISCIFSHFVGWKKSLSYIVHGIVCINGRYYICVGRTSQLYTSVYKHWGLLRYRFQFIALTTSNKDKITENQFP